jgi:hypothetical protein
MLNFHEAMQGFSLELNVHTVYSILYWIYFFLFVKGESNLLYFSIRPLAGPYEYNASLMAIWILFQYN